MPVLSALFVVALPVFLPGEKLKILETIVRAVIVLVVDVVSLWYGTVCDFPNLDVLT
jgi:hypothetical protein